MKKDKKIKEGDFIFTFATGVCRVSSADADYEKNLYEVAIVKSGDEATLSSKDKGFRFLKAHDPELATPLEEMSTEELREKQRQVASVKAVGGKTKTSTRKKKEKSMKEEDLMSRFAGGEITKEEMVKGIMLL